MKKRNKLKREEKEGKFWNEKKTWWCNIGREVVRVRERIEERKTNVD